MNAELPPLPERLRVYTIDGTKYVDGGAFADWFEIQVDRERILQARIAELEADAERLNYIERTFAGCTTQDRYLPIRMIWGKGCNGRTLREACDKYMARDAAREGK